MFDKFFEQFSYSFVGKTMDVEGSSDEEYQDKELDELIQKDFFDLDDEDAEMMMSI